MRAAFPLASTALERFDVLIIEDNPIDAELLVRLLRHSGILSDHRVASDERGIRLALQDFSPDVVLCDFALREYDGFEAIRLVHLLLSGVPLIFVSGSLTERQAIDAMKCGAVDYILKTQMLRLPSAIGAAVFNARQALRLTDELRAAEQRSREHATRLESVFDIVNSSNRRTGGDRWLEMLSQAATRLMPGQEYDVVLGRVDGSNLVIEELVEMPLNVIQSDDLAQRVYGVAVPIAKTLLDGMLERGVRTQVWEDVTKTDVVGSARAQGQGWRAVALSTFAAGNSAWMLGLLSRKPAVRSFDRHDHNYLEVLTSFFANHVERTWASERLKYQQSHDILTGLANRSSFRSQVRAAAATATSYGIVNVNINGFRHLNQAYGNLRGDALLQEVGAALKRRANDSEIVGRMAGDVFAIYVPAAASHEFLQARAAHFAQVFASPFSSSDDGEFVALTATLGLAAAPQDGETFDEVTAHADAAIFVARQRGEPEAIASYEAGMEGEEAKSIVARDRIARAIRDDHFELYFQPHIDLRNGRVTGCEALIRWRDPELGLLLPREFIPLAEKNGSIASIDRWVMRASIAAVAKLAALRPDIRLYFNVSARLAGTADFVDDLVEQARAACVLENIGIEITETDAMRNVDATQRICRALREAGIKVALDDFGTGYSSLSALKQLPLDIVKIDQSFVAGLLTDHHDRVIATTIISIAQQFGFELIAEGVETDEQRNWLRERSCTYAQGFGISHPLPFDTFVTWLAQRTAPHTGVAR